MEIPYLYIMPNAMQWFYLYSWKFQLNSMHMVSFSSMNTGIEPSLTSYLGASLHESSWKEKESPRKFRWKSCSAAL